MISFLYSIGYSLYCNWFKYLPKNNQFVFKNLQEGEIILKSNIQNSSYPTLLIVPGTTGDTENLFFSKIVDFFIENHFNVIFILTQGQKLNKTESIPVVNPKFSSSKDTFHIEISVQKIKETITGPLFLMGVSFGALYVKNYLCKDKNDIQCGMCVASPWCLEKTLNFWKKGKVIKYFYDQSFTGYYKNLIHSNWKVFEEYEKQNPNFKIEKFLEAKDIPELLNFCAILDNNKSFDQFMKESSGQIENLKTPLLIIHSKDDPVCPYENIPLDKIDHPHHIYLSDYGGHMGWINNVDQICLDWCKKFLII
jgi:predicted alpha/beta-fold hydrolase